MRSAVVRGFAAGLIVGTLAVGTAAVAKADPDDASFAYYHTFGQAVCSTLDDFPTFAGIQGIGDVIVDDGLSSKQAGYVIALSVTELCPRHLALIQSFAKRYVA